MGDVRDLIILGCGPTNVECKYHCETWGVNGTYTFAKRLDKLFMSDEEDEVKECWYDLVRMVRTDTTLILPVSYPKIAQTGLPVEIYPIEKVMERFPSRFHSNTITYMLAYALLHTKTIQGPDDHRPTVVEGYNPIYFYGIDMMTNSTYIQEKGGVEYWMGIAFGMGVNIINPRGSATGKTWNGRMYGYYGKQEDELLQEGLFAPWEIIRFSKASDQQDDWVKIDDEYRKVPYQTKIEAYPNQ